MRGWQLTALTALTGLACQGNPEVRTGDGLLEFGTTSTTGHRLVTTPQLSLYVAAPFLHWSFNSTALENDALANASFILPNIGLDQAPLFVRYRNSTAFWFEFATLSPSAGAGGHFDVANQHEILLFARDPAEQSASMRTVAHLTDVNVDQTTFPAIWNSAWDPALVPQLATIQYPPQAGWQTVTPLNNPKAAPVLVSTITSANFWGTNTPAGPGASPTNINVLASAPNPDTSGSIKAAAIVNHGVCSQALPFLTGSQPLFPAIAQAIPAFLEKRSCEQLALTEGGALEVRWLNIGSFIDQTQPDEDAQHGGFLLNTTVGARRERRA